MQADLCGPKEACIRWGVHHFPNTTDDLCSSIMCSLVTITVAAFS